MSTINNDEDNNKKLEQLETYKVDDFGTLMTTDQGLKVSEDEISLKAGTRGPTIMEDFHFREKLTHFDHERIPERVVHARGSAAHGYFQLYNDLSHLTKAKFLTDTSKQTPVFVRFSTVNGSKGSADTVRDARGFATKFYTEEGNYDLVGNNIPVFFIQDAIKFPDLVHAFKPEPNNEIPQASTAHDTFWDFVAHNQESAHMVMWVMSDRAIPRSFRMMDGFGVHTFRLVNEQGQAHFVKFHWKPVLGVHSLVWPESHELAGINPDFHRKDLWDAIENEQYPEYELAIQVIAESDEFNLGIDILDATKLWPEELVPLTYVGKMTLNQNVDNFFTETEQVAFHVGNVVPGIDFTNDPLLQGRLFSYLDTQLIRLGGPNFTEIPINRPIAPVHNNQRDGYHRMRINKGNVSYHRNGLAQNYPRTATEAEGGYKHYEQKVEGKIIRARSDSFNDHFSQAALFYNSMQEWEKQHIRNALVFELSNVKSKTVRQEIVNILARINYDLATNIASQIGVPSPQIHPPVNSNISPALSMQNTIYSTETLNVAIIVADGFDGVKLTQAINKIEQSGANVFIVSDRIGMIPGLNNASIEADYSFINARSIQFDSVYLFNIINNPAFIKSATLFAKEAYSHYKPIAIDINLKKLAEMEKWVNQPGVIIEQQTQAFLDDYIEALAVQRFWNRIVI